MRSSGIVELHPERDCTRAASIYLSEIASAASRPRPAPHAARDQPIADAIGCPAALRAAVELPAARHGSANNHCSGRHGKKKAPQKWGLFLSIGAPGEIRTPGL